MLMTELWARAEPIIALVPVGPNESARVHLGAQVPRRRDQAPASIHKTSRCFTHKRVSLRLCKARAHHQRCTKGWTCFRMTSWKVVSNLFLMRLTKQRPVQRRPLPTESSSTPPMKTVSWPYVVRPWKPERSDFLFPLQHPPHPDKPQRASFRSTSALFRSVSGPFGSVSGLFFGSVFPFRGVAWGGGSEKGASVKKKKITT